MLISGLMALRAFNRTLVSQADDMTITRVYECKCSAAKRMQNFEIDMIGWNVMKCFTLLVKFYCTGKCEKILAFYVSASESSLIYSFYGVQSK